MKRTLFSVEKVLFKYDITFSVMVLGIRIYRSYPMQNKGIMLN